MAPLKRLFQRLLHAVFPARAEADLDREIASHLALLEEDYRRRGFTPAEARRRARLALGGIDQTKERHRDARAFRWLDDARRDAVYAVRMLRRHKITAAAAALSLALGIGLNAAIFAVVDWVLIRPLPYPAAHELVRVFTAGTTPVTRPSPVTYQEFSVFGGASAFRASAAFNTTTRALAASGIDPVHAVVARVAGDLFATLGVYPEAGRGFSATEI